jgi:hypothetical protein
VEPDDREDYAVGCRAPGDEWVEVSEVSDLATNQLDASVGGGVTLRWATERFGGYVGRLTHPRTGTSHEVDLRAFAGRDLEATRVSIRFGYVDPAKVGTKRSDYLPE